jgi:hypothetical protein
VVLEAEVTNSGALALYGKLGFIRAKRLHNYYLNGVDAFRLKLLFPQAYMEEAPIERSNNFEIDNLIVEQHLETANEVTSGESRRDQKALSSESASKESENERTAHERLPQPKADRGDQRHHSRTSRIPDQIL